MRRYHTLAWSDVPSSLFFLVRDCLLSLPALLLRHWGGLLVCFGFVAFLVWNGGSVVLGDRDNHIFSPHWPQLMYFATFAAGSTAVNWVGVRHISAALESMWRNRASTMAVLAAMLAAVHLFTSVAFTER